jgi:predicted RNase H-like nuclease (RuvC/YqgF family)
MPYDPALGFTVSDDYHAAAAENEHRAEAHRPAVLGRDAAKLDAELEKLEAKRAALEAEQRAQQQLVHTWNTRLKSLDALKARRVYVQDEIAQLEASIPGRLDWLRNQAGNPHEVLVPRACSELAGTRAQISGRREVLPLIIADIEAETLALRAFGKENGIPENLWPEVPANSEP